MRVLVSLVSMVAVVVLIGAGSAQDKKGADGDAEKLQGTWIIVVKDKQLTDAKLVFKGDRLTIHDGKIKFEAIFKLDPSKKPKHFDMKPVEGSGDYAPGIYELDGDNLKLCWHGAKNPERPTKFADDPSRKPSPKFVVLKRQK